MSSFLSMASIALLQPEPPKTYTGAIQFVITTGLVLVVFVIVIFYFWQSMKKSRDVSISAELNQEFEKSKEALLLAAQQKKAASRSSEKTSREAEKEAREIELLKENVDPATVIGQTCPLCRLEMVEDQDLVIDPYTGQGYHFSSFLNDWPMDLTRPKYMFRYPQGTIVKSENIVKGTDY